MDELKNVLLPGETIIWKGSPRALPFIFSRSFAAMVTSLILLLFFGGLLLFLFSLSNDFPFSYTILFIPTMLLVLFGYCFPIFHNFFAYRNTRYALTNKRLIIQSGIIGRDFYALARDRITNAWVAVGFFDKLFGGSTGSVFVSTAGTFAVHAFFNIEKPYEIFNTINAER